MLPDVLVHLLLSLQLGTVGERLDVFYFEYAPEIDHRVTRIFEAEGQMRFRGIPVVPDRTNGRFQSMTSLTERVWELLDDGAITAVVYDSSFAQYSLGGGWVELPVEWSSLGPYEWLRDSGYRPSPISLPEDPFFVNVARGLQWTPDIPLPDDEVRVGDSWLVELDFPITTQIPSDSALLISIDMFAQGTARLDSVVTRPSDTLAFVSLAAQLDAATVNEAYSHSSGDLAVALSGSITGSYIWSTGWYTWVTNESRVTIEHRIAGLSGATMHLVLTAGSRIRP